MNAAHPVFASAEAEYDYRSALFGAANEVRTRDVLLGKQVLYQLSYSRIIWCPRSDSNRHVSLRQNLNLVRLPISPPGHKLTYLLEQRVRFELTVLRICNPLHWASLPPLHTLGVPPGTRTLTESTYMASRLGFEPRMLILEIKVLPITLSRYFSFEEARLWSTLYFHILLSHLLVYV